MASFVSVLKKIGQILVKGAAITSEIMGFPFVSQILGAIKIGGTTAGGIATTVSNDFGTLAGIISVAETMFPAPGSGSSKLQAASPLIQQALLSWAQSNLPGHNKVKDPLLLAKAAGEITTGFADFMNALGD